MADDRGHGAWTSRLSDENASTLREALQALAPGDAEAKLRWLLDFSQRDLSALSAREWVLERLRIMWIGWRDPWEDRQFFTPQAKTFVSVDAEGRRVLQRRIQHNLRECFESLVRNEPLYVLVPAGRGIRPGDPVLLRTTPPARLGHGHWTIMRTPPPRRACPETSCPYLKPCPVHRSVGRPVDLSTTADKRVSASASFLGYWWLELVLLSVRLLEEVGAWKLMACPFQKSREAPPCARLFLARRRQQYCSIEHTRAAAFQRWLSKPERGGTRAKR